MRFAFLLFIAASGFSQTPWASSVRVPSSDKMNSFYFTNQAPLKSQHLVKLPVGAIKPGGWLLKSLELERDGLAGNLGEISAWLTKKITRG